MCVYHDSSFPPTHLSTHIQCDDCALSYTEQTWKAVVQVRQRVEHKRTFFFLEQLLIAKKMESKLLDIDLAKDGLGKLPPTHPPTSFHRPFKPPRSSLFFY